MELTEPLTGIVTHKTKGFYFVDDSQKHTTLCTAKGVFFKDSHFDQQIVVGDIVKYCLNGEQGVITYITPRRNSFSRCSVHAAAEQILAANLDYLAILAAASSPAWQDNWVLRLLLAANLGQVKPLLIISKTDLEKPAHIQRLKAPYQKIGISVLDYNITDEKSLKKLKKTFQSQTVALVGRSGVGKTSLLNYFCPNLNLKTGTMHSKSLTGKHTTSLSRMLYTDFDACLIDTPGLKKYAFWQLTKMQLARSFPGFAPYSTGCKYKNCAHVDEPDCKITQAVKNESLPLQIYQGYLSILSTLDTAF